MTSMSSAAIASPSNPRIKGTARLRDRRQRDATGLTLVDGTREVRRALDAGAGVVEAFVCEPFLAGEDARAALDALASHSIPTISTTEAAFAKVAFGDRSDGLVAVVRIPPMRLDDLALPDDPLIVVLPPKHPLTKQRKVRFSDVLKFPLIGMSVGGALDTFLQEKAESLHLKMYQPVGVASYDAGCRMIEVGLGIAIMPSSAVLAYAGTKRFVRRPLDEPWRDRSLRVYALRKSSRLRAVEALLATLGTPGAG